MYSGDCAGLPLSAFYTAKLWEVFEKMKKSYEMDMCTGPLLKKLLIFAVPLILSGVLQLLFNAADIVVVGKFAGSHALAAVGSTGALINLFTNVFICFSIGANVLVAQYFGAKDEQNIQDTVHTSMAIGIIGGMFLIVAGMIFAPMMLEVMATPEEVLGQAALYIRIYFIGMPAMLIYNFGAAVLRAIGDTRKTVVLSAGGRCGQCDSESGFRDRISDGSCRCRYRDRSFTVYISGTYRTLSDEKWGNVPFVSETDPDSQRENDPYYPDRTSCRVAGSDFFNL